MGDFPMMIFCFVALTGFSLMTTGLSKSGHCETENNPDYVLCYGSFSDENVLKEEIEAIESPFSVFYLRDAQMDTLPSDIFSDLANGSVVDRVIFEGVSVKLFHVSLLGIPPFHSLRDTLEKFEIYASDGLFAWNWSSLSELRRLRTLIIEDCNMYSVPASLGTAPGLRLVELRNAEIYYLEDNLFKGSTKLTFFSISGNHLKFLKRSWFPDPAEKLWSMDFSRNKLESLPDDAFVNMPSLHEVKIDHNRLQLISHLALAPVWRHLTELWLHGNDLLCESLCWTKSSISNLMFLNDAYCRENKRYPKLLLITYLEKCK